MAGERRGKAASFYYGRNSPRVGSKHAPQRISPQTEAPGKERSFPCAALPMRCIRRLLNGLFPEKAMCPNRMMNEIGVNCHV